jgi:hypothetical protein
MAAGAFTFGSPAPVERPREPTAFSAAPAAPSPAAAGPAAAEGAAAEAAAELWAARASAAPAASPPPPPAVATFAQRQDWVARVEAHLLARSDLPVPLARVVEAVPPPAGLASAAEALAGSSRKAIVLGPVGHVLVSLVGHAAPFRSNLPGASGPGAAPAAGVGPPPAAPSPAAPAPAAAAPSASACRDVGGAVATADERAIGALVASLVAAAHAEPRPQPPLTVALKCVPSARGGGGLDALALAWAGGALLVDAGALGGGRACELVWPLLASARVRKVVHGARAESALLLEHGGVFLSAAGLLDSQLGAEALGARMSGSLGELLAVLGLGADAEAAEPPPAAAPLDAAAGARWAAVLARAAAPLAAALAAAGVTDAVCAASGARALAALATEQDDDDDDDDDDERARALPAGARAARAAARAAAAAEVAAAFDRGRSYALASADLLARTRPHDAARLAPPDPPTGSVADIAAGLPRALAAALGGAARGDDGADGGGHVRQVLLRLGEPPVAWSHRGAISLVPAAAAPTTAAELAALGAALGGWRDGGRARVDQSLHRATAVLLGAEVVGASLTVRQAAIGCATALADLLLHTAGPRNLLVVGAARAGKSALLRDCARELAVERWRIVVALEGEAAALGGDGARAAAGLGRALRLPRAAQGGTAASVREALSTYGAHVLILDALDGGADEARELARARQRRARVLAGADGGLRELLAARAAVRGAEGSASASASTSASASAFGFGFASLCAEFDAVVEIVADEEAGCGRSLLVIADLPAAVRAVRAGEAGWEARLDAVPVQRRRWRARSGSKGRAELCVIDLTLGHVVPSDDHHIGRC